MNRLKLLAASLGLTALAATAPIASAEPRAHVNIDQVGYSNEVSGRQLGYQVSLSVEQTG